MVSKFIVGLKQWFSAFSGPWTIFLKKYPMDHFVMLTSHEQLVETVLHIISELKGMFYLGTLWSTRNSTLRISGLKRSDMKCHVCVLED